MLGGLSKNDGDFPSALFFEWCSSSFYRFSQGQLVETGHVQHHSSF